MSSLQDAHLPKMPSLAEGHATHGRRKEDFAPVDWNDPMSVGRQCGNAAAARTLGLPPAEPLPAPTPRRQQPSGVHVARLIPDREGVLGEIQGTIEGAGGTVNPALLAEVERILDSTKWWSANPIWTSGSYDEGGMSTGLVPDALQWINPLSYLSEGLGLGEMNSVTDECQVQVKLTSYIENEMPIGSGEGSVEGTVGGESSQERNGKDTMSLSGTLNGVTGGLTEEAGWSAEEKDTSEGSIHAPVPTQVTEGDWILEAEITITTIGGPQTISIELEAGRIALADLDVP